MGQRLVVNIVKDNIVLANSYYHWSGYTDSALCITVDCIKRFAETKYEDDIEKAIDMLYATGAGMELAEENNKVFFEHKAKNPFFSIPFVKGTDRNSGLIAIAKDSITESQNWSEGDVFIDIGTKTVDFRVLYEVDKDSLVEDECYREDIEFDELSNEEIEQKYINAVDKLKTVDYPYDENEEISFDNFEDFAYKVSSIDEGMFKLSDGTVIGKI